MWEPLSLYRRKEEGGGGGKLFLFYLFILIGKNYANNVRRSRYQVYLFNGKFTFLL